MLPGTLTQLLYLSTCTLLEYFHLLLLYAFTPPALKADFVLMYIYVKALVSNYFVDCMLHRILSAIIFKKKKNTYSNNQKNVEYQFW